MASSVQEANHQAIIIAAARTQRAIQKVHLVLAVLFIATLMYVFANLVVALLGRPTDEESKPTPSTSAVLPVPQPVTLTGTIDQTTNLAERQAAREKGLTYVAPTEGGKVDSGPGSRLPQNIDDPLRKATPEDLEKFRKFCAEGAKALDDAFNYSQAITSYTAALAVPQISAFDRERAGFNFDRARVFLTLTQGVTPLTTSSRIVRYTAPTVAGKVQTLAAVAKAAAWQVGRIYVTRLSDDMLLELNVGTDWMAQELTPAEASAALVERMKARLAALAQKRKDNRATPLDLVAVATAALETGDQTAPAFNAKMFAHACLTEAFEWCDSCSVSLSETLLLRSDPEFFGFVSQQSKIDALTRKLNLAKDEPARKAVQEDLDRTVNETQATLANLTRRYARAWDFKDQTAEMELSNLRERLAREAAEAARREAAKPAPPTGEDEEQARLDRPADTMSVNEKARWYIERGKAAAEAGQVQADKTRAPNFDDARLYSTLSGALAKYKEARSYFRQAAEADPAHKQEIEELIVDIQGKIFWLQKTMPLGGK